MPFATLLYRYLFFDWLFADVSAAQSLRELESAWQHNREMAKYLPVYLRRWTVLTVLAFALGHLCDQAPGISVVAALFFMAFCVMLTGIVVTLVLWIRLSGQERS